MNLKRKTTVIMALAVALMFLFSSVASAALPTFIYCEDSDGNIVKADYNAAIEQATEGNTAMLTAITDALKYANNNFKKAIVALADGKVIDWQAALDAGVGFTDAQAVETYNAVVPDSNKVIDESGNVVDPEVAVDKAALAAEIAGVEALTAADYTAESWEALQTALTAAKAVNDDAAATQDDVNNVLAALTTAKEALVTAPTALAVESVSAITTTGVDVVLAEVEEAQEDVTIEVTNPSGEIVPVDAINLEVGDSEVTFDFSTALSEVELGIWTVGGVEFDTAAQAAVDAVVGFTTQVELWAALQSSYFTGAVAESIDAYEAAFTTAIAADEVNTVADVQAIIDEVNAQGTATEEEAEIVKAVADATNQLTLLQALQNDAFERVNADWIADYAAENVTVTGGGTPTMLALAAANYFGEAAGADIEGIQAAIDAANDTNVQASITAAQADLSLTKIASARTLVNTYIPEDVAPATTKAGYLEALAEHEAVVNVTLANTNAKLQNAFNTLAGLTNNFDIDTVNPLELTRYRTDIGAAAQGAKDDATKIQTLVTTANTNAEAAAVTAFADANFDTDTPLATVNTRLETLGDRASFGSTNFDYDTIIEALLEEYRTALAGEADGDKDDATKIQGIIDGVNDPATALTTLVDAGNALDDADLLLAALKAKTLDLDVVDANKAAYFQDIAAIKTAAGTNAAAVQLVVDAIDARVALNAATTDSAAQSAILNFSIAENIAAYINLSSTGKLEVTQLVVAERPTTGYATNALLNTEVGNQITARGTLIANVNTAGPDAGDIASMNTALTALEYAPYKALSAAEKVAVAEAFLNAFPTAGDPVAQVDYTTISAIQADIDAAIAAQ